MIDRITKVRFGNLTKRRWLIDNEIKIKSAFPVVWAKMTELQHEEIKRSFNRLGLDVRSNRELDMVVRFLVETGFVLQRHHLVMANPLRVMPY